MATKMYILIKDSIPVGQAVLAAAHASLSGYLTFTEKDRLQQAERETPLDKAFPTEDWARESFRKVICKVTDAEFEKAKDHGMLNWDYRIMTESSLGGIEVALVFKPKEEWPKFFNFLKLYK